MQTLFKNQLPGSLHELISEAAGVITKAFRQGNKLLVCGNGGSSSDSDHIVGELMKSFEIDRPLQPELRRKLEDGYGEQGSVLARKLQHGLPAVSLSAHNALVTAISNDMGSDYVFAQQVIGYGKKGDVLLAISTSGNSENVCNALLTARAISMRTIGLTGRNDGKMNALCDVLIDVPATQTARIQEYHLPVYHAIVRMVEREMYGAKEIKQMQ